MTVDAQYRTQEPDKLFFRDTYNQFSAYTQATLLLHEYYHRYQHLNSNPNLTPAEIEFEAHLYVLMYAISAGIAHYSSNLDGSKKFDDEVKTLFNIRTGLPNNAYMTLYNKHIGIFQNYTNNKALTPNYNASHIKNDIQSGGCY